MGQIEIGPSIASHVALWKSSKDSAKKVLSVTLQISLCCCHT